METNEKNIDLATSQVHRTGSREDSEKGANTQEVDSGNLPVERRQYAKELAMMSPEEYAAFEKKTVWKMDLRIVPWITVLYLISFLDRVNVGAAKLVGLTTDLNLSPLDFSNASMIFFISYVIFEVPSNLVLKRFKPSRWIPATMVAWAVFQLAMGFVKTYGQLLALRFCLGIFEAGLFPGLNLYLTGWYKRDEINKRVAVFFAGAVASGAFGGIFGFALGKMAGIAGLNGWQWIFIIEGLLTFVIGVASYWMVQDWPQDAKMLTPLEKEFVLTRLAKEQGVGDAPLTKSIAKQAFLDWKMWAMMLCYIGAGEPLYSLALFSPSVIATLGTFSRPTSLLLSTPPYVLCLITTIGTGYFSDRAKRRAPFLIFWGSICALGYILLLAIPVSQPGARYFAVFVAASGAGPMIATTISWTANTWTPHHYKKAICMGCVFMAGNSGGIISSQVYRDNDAPRYVPGHAVAVAFSLCNVFAASLMWYKFSKENKRRDALYGKPVSPDDGVDINSDEYREKVGLTGMSELEIMELADNHPNFRYVV